MDFGSADHRRITATRADTIAGIKKLNLHRKYPLTHSKLEEFVCYEQSFEGNSTPPNTAKAKAARISRYLHYKNPVRLNVTLATDSRQVSNYLQFLRQNTSMAASTLRNEAQAFIDFSDFVSSQKYRRIDEKEHFRCKLLKVKRALRKALRRRKAHNKRSMTQESLPGMAEVGKLCSKRSYIKKLIDDGEALDRSEQNTVTSYILTCLALKNGARASHVTNLSNRDFNTGKKVDETYQVTCSYSKNSDKEAIVSFDKGDLQLTRCYIAKVRPHISKAGTSPSDPLFPTLAGKALKNFSSPRHLYKVEKMCGFTSMFSLSDWRKAITTKAARTYSGDRHSLRLVSDYLCHSAEIAEEYYTEGARPRESLNSYQIIQRLFTT